MDSRIAKPFVAATAGAVYLMLREKVVRGAPFLRAGFDPTVGDVSGVVRLSGGATGTVVLSLPYALALRIYAAVVGNAHPGFGAVESLVADAVARIASGARAAFSEFDINLRPGEPSVFSGALRALIAEGLRQDGPPWIVMPFRVGGDEFWTQAAITLERPELFCPPEVESRSGGQGILSTMGQSAG